MTHVPINGDLTFRKADRPSDPAHGIHAAVEIRIDDRIVGVIAPPRPRVQVSNTEASRTQSRTS